MDSFNERSQKIDTLPSIKELLVSNGFNTRRSLGQNFICDPSITDRIVDAAGDLTQGTAIEIGPGPGGLTRSLLRSPIPHVIAIEKDARALELLAPLQNLFPKRLTLIHQDALKCSFENLGTSPRFLISNLPYNVGTPLLLHALFHGPCFEKFVLMFQKEVALRLCAHPSTSAYGRLSVITQFLSDPVLEFTLPPSAFLPPPKVSSSVVCITPHLTPPFPCQRTDLEHVLRAAFCHRRKMLRSSLKSLVNDPEMLLAESHIAGTRRPETLSLEEFCTLARIFKNMSSNPKTL